MRKTYESGKNIFAFGVDCINGVFLQVLSTVEPIKVTNWSEFEPAQLHLTYDSIQEAIKEGKLLESDFIEICKIPIGDYKVYFSGVERIPEDFILPKTILNKYLKGQGHRIRTLGDYYKILKWLKRPVPFSKITWYENCKSASGPIYEIKNDFSCFL